MLLSAARPSPSAAVPSPRRFTHCAVVLFHEFQGITQEVELTRQGPNGICTLFSCQDLKARPGGPGVTGSLPLLAEDAPAATWIDRLPYSPALAADHLPPQLHPREWFGGGATYQIFPDRFLPSHGPLREGPAGDRLVHQDWDSTAEWEA